MRQNYTSTRQRDTDTAGTTSLHILLLYTGMLWRGGGSEGGGAGRVAGGEEGVCGAPFITHTVVYWHVVEGGRE